MLSIYLSNLFAEGVQLSLKGASIANNSYVDVSDIGVDGDALLCHTDKSGCCGGPRDREGEWYFLNGSNFKVDIKGNNPSENLFYRNRGTKIVRLNRLGSPPERGRFRCTVSNAKDVQQTVFVNIGMFNACMSNYSI